MSWNDDVGDYDDPELLLPEARLQVEGDRLLRLNEDGTTLMSIRLSSIVAVQFRYRFDPTSLVFFAATAGLLAIGKYATDTTWLRCLLYFLAIVAGFISCCAIFDKVISIQQDDGSLDIYCADSKDKVQGFVISLREILADR